MRQRFLLIGLIIGLVVPSSAYAHHEAIFGPQSAAVLSASEFLSAQVFTKSTGKDEEKKHETTTVLSGGLRPTKRPLSLSFVVPVTFGSVHDGHSSNGFEDSLISARYRVNADQFAKSIGLQESYVMGVGGVELPTGTLDHDFARGPVGEIAAGLFSVEKRPIAAIAYVYYHHAGEYHGARQSGNAFFGTGIAYTPIDDELTGKLFSLQLGLSHEKTFAEEEDGLKLADTGGSGVFLHPGIVASTNEWLQWFALVSLPVTQDWRDPADKQNFRFGAGAILILKH